MKDKSLYKRIVEDGHNRWGVVAVDHFKRYWLAAEPGSNDGRDKTFNTFAEAIAYADKEARK